MEYHLQANERHYFSHLSFTTHSSLQEVWQFFATSVGLKKWFTQLHLEEKDQQLLLVFEMENFREEMKVLTYEAPNTFEFEWAGAVIKLSFAEEEQGTSVKLTETIPKDFENPYSSAAQDLAGWAIHMERNEQILANQTPAEVAVIKDKWQTIMEAFVSENK